MNETLDYIESYFENSLTAEDRMRFEQRISTDAAFASEVAFYIQARQALRNELVQEKKKSWKSVSAVTSKLAPVIPIKKPSPIRRWMAVAAGVIVILGVSLIFFLNRNGQSANPVSAEQLAQQYSDSAFKTLGGTTMGIQDDFQKGIAAYNNGFADSAERIFSRVYQQDSTNFQALEYSGHAALKSKHYDQAIKQFQALEKKEDYASNPALFYQAIARLQRNSKGDEVESKRLLQQIRESNSLSERIKQKTSQILDHIN